MNLAIHLGVLSFCRLVTCGRPGQRLGTETETFLTTMQQVCWAGDENVRGHEVFVASHPRMGCSNL
jgi:hypothetical protein